MQEPSDVLDASARARVDTILQRAFDEPALVATLTSSDRPEVELARSAPMRPRGTPVRSPMM